MKDLKNATLSIILIAFALTNKGLLAEEINPWETVSITEYISNGTTSDNEQLLSLLFSSHTPTEFYETVINKLFASSLAKIEFEKAKMKQTCANLGRELDESKLAFNTQLTIENELKYNTSSHLLRAIDLIFKIDFTIVSLRRDENRNWRIEIDDLLRELIYLDYDLGTSLSSELSRIGFIEDNTPNKNAYRQIITGDLLVESFNSIDQVCSVTDQTTYKCWSTTRSLLGFTYFVKETILDLKTDVKDELAESLKQYVPDISAYFSDSNITLSKREISFFERWQAVKTAVKQEVTSQATTWGAFGAIIGIPGGPGTIGAGAAGGAGLGSFMGANEGLWNGLLRPENYLPELKSDSTNGSSIPETPPISETPPMPDNPDIPKITPEESTPLPFGGGDGDMLLENGCGKTIDNFDDLTDPVVDDSSIFPTIYWPDRNVRPSPTPIPESWKQPEICPPFMEHAFCLSLIAQNIDPWEYQKSQSDLDWRITPIGP